MNVLSRASSSSASAGAKSPDAAGAAGVGGGTRCRAQFCVCAAVPGGRAQQPGTAHHRAALDAQSRDVCAVSRNSGRLVSMNILWLSSAFLLEGTSGASSGCRGRPTLRRTCSEDKFRYEKIQGAVRSRTSCDDICCSILPEIDSAACNMCTGVMNQTLPGFNLPQFQTLHTTAAGARQAAGWRQCAPCCKTACQLRPALQVCTVLACAECCTRAHAM